MVCGLTARTHKHSSSTEEVFSLSDSNPPPQRTREGIYTVANPHLLYGVASALLDSRSTARVTGLGPGCGVRSMVCVTGYGANSNLIQSVKIEPSAVQIFAILLEGIARANP